MKPWKALSLILFAYAVAIAGDGLNLVRHGFSALATPSAVEELAATTARKLAVPSANVSIPAAVSVFPGENYQAREVGPSGRITNSCTTTN